MENLDVHGHSVNFDDGAREGVHALINMDYDQAQALFNQAASNGSTSFHCDAGGYKIVWSGDSYNVSKAY